MPAIPGYLGRILVNSTVLRAHRWTVDWKCDDFDVTTFENNRVGIYLPGIVDFTITADAYFDTLDNPFGGVLAINPGNFAVLRILHDKTGLADNHYWHFPNVLFTDVRSESGARDVVRYNFTAKASAYYAGAATGIRTPAN